MRIANLSGRLALIVNGRAVDAATASDGRFSADPQAVFERFEEFRAWAAAAPLPAGTAFDPAGLGAPAPWPRQIFAIGLNYRAHAAESGFAAPPSPAVFTKFVTSVSGPYTEVRLPEGDVDWEVELVAVIGRRAEHVAAPDAWSHVAGLTAGQDISERVLQMVGAVPQFSLAKSYPGFTPIGPWLITADEFNDPDDLELSCAVNGELMQKARTSEMIFSVPELIEKLSAVTPLLPGDVIFTGTPSGVGMGRTPKRFLRPGDVLTSTIEGIGDLRQRFVR
jgi:2-keto-4-pentenoate hydratase/2-oxohepta-3-ene-1,7-dioic acid hydratase in catechol pathway